MSSGNIGGRCLQGWRRCGHFRLTAGEDEAAKRQPPGELLPAGQLARSNPKMANPKNAKSCQTNHSRKNLEKFSILTP